MKNGPKAPPSKARTAIGATILLSCAAGIWWLGTHPVGVQSAPGLRMGDAFKRCKPLIDAQLARPATADYAMFAMALSEEEQVVANERRHILYDKLTAENGFGATVQLQARCELLNGVAQSASVAEL
jgi:hypothetical protein